MASNHVPLKRGSQRKSTSRKVMPSLGPGRRVVGHVVTWRSHTAAVLATAPLAPATPGHFITRYMHPEGPWQRRAFLNNLILPRTSSRRHSGAHISMYVCTDWFCEQMPVDDDHNIWANVFAPIKAAPILSLSANNGIRCMELLVILRELGRRINTIEKKPIDQNFYPCK